MATTASHTGTDRSDLSAWLDGELPDDELARLEEELSRDPELKAELDALETVVSFVRATAPAAAPADFTERLMARIDREERPSNDRRRRPFGVPREPLQRWAVGIAAAAAVALILVRARPPEPAGGETESQTWSPAALEQPRVPDQDPATPAEVAKDGAETAAAKRQPIARGSTNTAAGEAVLPNSGGPNGGGPLGGGPGGAGEILVEEGGAAPQESAPAVVVPGTDAPFLPTDDGPLPAVMFSVKSADPSMKRQVLATVARYGEVLTNGLDAPQASMAGPTERLRVLLRQDQLAEFQQDLVASGYTVRHWFTGQLAGRDTVEIEVVLQQASPDGEAPTLP